MFLLPLFSLQLQSKRVQGQSVWRKSSWAALKSLLDHPMNLVRKSNILERWLLQNWNFMWLVARAAISSLVPIFCSCLTVIEQKSWENLKINERNFCSLSVSDFLSNHTMNRDETSYKQRILRKMLTPSCQISWITRVKLWSE